MCTRVYGTTVTGAIVTTPVVAMVALLSAVFALSLQAAEKLDDKCWTPSFTENFDTLDLWDAGTGEGRWKTAYIWDRGVRINNELQYYVDPRIHAVNPFSVKDGILSIRADRAPTALQGETGLPFTSGVLTTEKDFAQQYGRFDARVKVPAGRGLWPAFWLLPSFDRWPEGVAVLPEIDVMEFLGHELTSYHTTVHTNQTGELTSYPYAHNTRINLTLDFHVYSVVWEKDKLTWYFDGQEVASHPTPADFTRPVHFLLNLAVGGNWPGEPDKKTVFPADFQVDYVRAWTSSGACS